MKRPLVLLTAAVVVLVAHLAMRLLGLAVHTSSVAGMPVNDSSLVIGPIYIVIYLLAVTLAPILVFASLLELIALRYAGAGRSMSLERR